LFVNFFLKSLFLLLISIGSANAAVLMSKEEAMEAAFGKDAAIETLPIFIDDVQEAEIQRQAKMKLDTRLFHFFEGRRNGAVIGYAAIDTHTVRTQQETILVMLSPAGKLQRVIILAFHEPPEYRSPARWLDTLPAVQPDALFLSQGVDAVSGATLTSRAVVDAARRVTTVFHVAFKPEGQ